MSCVRTWNVALPGRAPSISIHNYRSMAATALDRRRGIEDRRHLCRERAVNTTADQTTLEPPPRSDDPVRVDVRRAGEPAPEPVSLERVRTALNDAIHADLATDLERV